MLIKHSCFIYSQKDNKLSNDGQFSGSSLSRQSERPRIKLNNYETTLLEKENGLNPVGAALPRVDIITDSFGNERLVKHSRYESVPRKKRPKREIIYMAERTKSKIRNKVRSWFYSKYYREKQNINKLHFTWWTLTLTGKMESQAQCHKMLNHFLTTVRQKFGKVNYLWVAEIQDGKRNKYSHSTGNVHYHLLTDKFLPVVEINKMWLHVLQENRFPFQSVKTGKSLNPVDVCHVKKPSTLSRYMTKYITKNESKLTVQCWNCSRSISRLATGLYRVLEEKIKDKLYSSIYGLQAFKEISRDFFKIHIFSRVSRYLYGLLSPLYQFNVKQLIT